MVTEVETVLTDPVMSSILLVWCVVPGKGLFPGLLSEVGGSVDGQLYSYVRF